MGIAHDALVDAKMTLEIFWTTWKYRVKYAHFFDVHCRLRMAPRAIYNRLAQHVSSSKKVVLKKQLNDLNFEKALFMKRNFCAYNCRHIYNKQVTSSPLHLDMD
jgi:hypothetical protein